MKKFKAFIIVIILWFLLITFFGTSTYWSVIEKDLERQNCYSDMCIQETLSKYYLHTDDIFNVTYLETVEGFWNWFIFS